MDPNYKDPPAELPQGSTNQPVATADPPPVARPAGVLTEEEQAVVNAWMPHLYGKMSAYLNGATVTTVEQCLEHVRAYTAAQAEEQTEEPVPDEHYATALEAWRAARSERKAAIDEAHATWRAALAQKKQAMQEWDAYCGALRDAWDEAKRAPRPVRPRKEGGGR